MIPVFLSFLLFICGFKISLRQSTSFARNCSIAVLLPFAYETTGYCVQCMIGIPEANFFMPFIDTSNPEITINIALIGLLLGLFRQNTILEVEQLHHWFLGEPIA